MLDMLTWLTQWLLALLFGMAGVTKTALPKDQLAARMPWSSAFTTRTLRTIGALEILGALGLVVPTLAGTWLWITPLAAMGLLLVMLLAARLHLQRQEPRSAAVNLVIAAIASMIAWLSMQAI